MFARRSDITVYGVMWIDCPDVVEKLRRIVGKMGGAPNQESDLLQEALLHLWITQERYPGNTFSWHLQSCVFHLKNLARKGKSIDSDRHRASITHGDLPSGSEND